MTIRGSIVVSISACHAEDPGSIPGRGVSRESEDSRFTAVGQSEVGFPMSLPRNHFHDRSRRLSGCRQSSTLKPAVSPKPCPWSYSG